MRINIIFAVVIAMIAITSASHAQSVSLGLTDLPTANLVRVDANFQAFPNFLGGVSVATSDLPADTEADCMAATDLSAAVPMDPAKYKIAYDRDANTLHFRFEVERERRYGCRVVRLIGDGQTDTRDFLVWQRNFGASAGRADQLNDGPSGERSADGSVRSVRYSIPTTILY